MLLCKPVSLPMLHGMQAIEGSFAVHEDMQNSSQYVVHVQVLQEVAGETIAQLAAAPRARRERPVAQAEPAEAEDEDDLAARLDAIRS